MQKMLYNSFWTCLGFLKTGLCGRKNIMQSNRGIGEKSCKQQLGSDFQKETCRDTQLTRNTQRIISVHFSEKYRLPTTEVE